MMLLDLINDLNYQLATNGNLPVDFQVKYVVEDSDKEIDSAADGIYDGELVDIVRKGSSLKIITLFEN